MKGSFIMKKLAEEATIENILESIKENKFNRIYYGIRTDRRKYVYQY